MSYYDVDSLCVVVLLLVALFGAILKGHGDNARASLKYTALLTELSSAKQHIEDLERALTWTPYYASDDDLWGESEDVDEDDLLPF